MAFATRALSPFLSAARERLTPPTLGPRHIHPRVDPLGSLPVEGGFRRSTHHTPPPCAAPSGAAPAGDARYTRFRLARGGSFFCPERRRSTHISPRSGVWPAETCASLSPSPARSASGATTRRTRASATTPIASRCASTASGAARTRAIGRPASCGGSVMARDRQRAKQRKARRAAQNPGPAPTEPHRTNVPGELEHASGDQDEFDAALVAGAGGVPVDADADDDDVTVRAELDPEDDAGDESSRRAL